MMNMIQRMVKTMSFGRTHDISKYKDLDTIWSAFLDDPDSLIALMGVKYTDEYGRTIRPESVIAHGKAAGIDVIVDIYFTYGISARDLTAGRSVARTSSITVEDS